MRPVLTWFSLLTKSQPAVIIFIFTFNQKSGSIIGIREGQYSPPKLACFSIHTMFNIGNSGTSMHGSVPIPIVWEVFCLIWILVQSIKLLTTTSWHAVLKIELRITP